MNQYELVGGSQLSYDDNGNLVQQSTTGEGLALQWDALNRLVQALRPDGTTVRFTYDAYGNQASRAVVFGNGAQTYRSYLHFDRSLYEVRDLDPVSGAVLDQVEILNQTELDSAPAVIELPRRRPAKAARCASFGSGARVSR